MSDLTSRQVEVLEVIKAFRTEHGYSPSYRELSSLLGGIGMNAVKGHLRALESKGKITRAGRKPRTLLVA